MKLTTGLTRNLVEVILGVAVACSLLHAQDGVTFKAQSTLATTRFHVVQKDQYVTGLKPEDVILLEDGVPRRFTVFENGVGSTSARPVEVTLLFDTSGSVMDKGLLDPLVFKESLLNALPGVKLAVYSFNSAMTRYTIPTSEVAPLTAAVNALREGGAGEQIALRLAAGTTAGQGKTWLYEALLAVLNEAAATPGQASRMVVLFSDGLTTTSATARDAAALSNELGIAVYPVVLGQSDLIRRFTDANQALQAGNQQLQEARSQQAAAESALAAQQMGSSKKNPPSSSPALKNANAMEKKASKLVSTSRDQIARLQGKQTYVADFTRLGDMTGGRSYDPPAFDLETLKRILGSIVAEMRTQYVVGFAPDAAPNPKKHKIEVRLANPQNGTVRGGQLSATY